MGGLAAHDLIPRVIGEGDRIAFALRVQVHDRPVDHKSAQALCFGEVELHALLQDVLLLLHLLGHIEEEEAVALLHHVLFGVEIGIDDLVVDPVAGGDVVRRVTVAVEVEPVAQIGRRLTGQVDEILLLQVAEAGRVVDQAGTDVVFQHIVQVREDVGDVAPVHPILGQEISLSRQKGQIVVDHIDHTGQRPGADVTGVGDLRLPNGRTGKVVPLEVQIPANDGAVLLLGDDAVGAELSVADAFDDVILGGPVDVGGSPAQGGTLGVHILEGGAGVLGRVDPLHAPQHGDEHGPGVVGAGGEDAVAHALHQVQLVEVLDSLPGGVVLRHVGEGILPRRARGDAGHRGQHQGGQEQGNDLFHTDALSFP